MKLMVDPNVVLATKNDIERLRRSLTQNINVVNTTLKEEIDGMKRNILRIGIELSVLMQAKVMDADNIAIEVFNHADDVIIICGFFDGENHRLYA